MIKRIEVLDHFDPNFFKGIMNVSQNVIHEHILQLNQNSNLKYFLAYGDNQDPIGGVCAHLCSGPLPFIPTFFKASSLWGLWGEKPILHFLIEKSVCYLKQLGTNKVMVYANTEEQYQALTDLKFTHSNNLECDLTKIDIELPPLPEGITIKPVGPEYDDVVYDHWQRMWEENGVHDFHTNSKEITLNFMKEARQKYNYRTTAAFDGEKVIGTVSNNIFFGVEPCEKVGTAWAVYVNKSYRRRGIGTRLVVEMQKYFKELGCKTMRLIYASEEGRRIYDRKGFKKTNWISLDSENLDGFHEPFVSNIQVAKDLNSMAIPAQLKAVNDTKTTSQFTGESFMEKVGKMGKGFDLKQLNSQKSVAEKFDRLSKNWEEAVTAMKYEYVFKWLVEKYRQNSLGNHAVVLDECCGIGLPGMTIRMAGFKGKLVGCDISKGMLEKAFQRGCFDELFEQDVNDHLKMFSESVDVLINVGSMELLNIENVVNEAARVIKKGGKFWVSFQWDNGSNSTDHQNIFGIKEDEARRILINAGFEIEDAEKCENAFLSPKQSENGPVLVPVPYLFIQAQKK